jgi:hypothetical protein
MREMVMMMMIMTRLMIFLWWKDFVIERRLGVCVWGGGLKSCIGIWFVDQVTLPSSWDYRCEPLEPSSVSLLWRCSNISNPHVLTLWFQHFAIYYLPIPHLCQSSPPPPFWPSPAQTRVEGSLQSLIEAGEPLGLSYNLWFISPEDPVLQRDNES